MVEQSVFLCLAVGVGGLVLPLMGGAPPPADLGSSPRETRKALMNGSAGILIFVSMLMESLGCERGGPTLRAIVVALDLVLRGGIWKGAGQDGCASQASLDVDLAYAAWAHRLGALA